MVALADKSLLMKALERVRLTPWAWSARRLHCPVSRDALVLEVGSGGNPYFRANVLLDAYEHTRERHWVALVTDRPIVLGFVESLPFRDKAFDFVIASHVLEHSTDPVRFLGELQRVAKAGYIEVPDAFMERINPYRDHRLEVTVRDDCLLIRKKVAWKVDSEVVDLYEARIKQILTRETMRRHPFEFHVRYYWKEVINYRVLNPKTDAAWPAPQIKNVQLADTSVRQRVGQLILKWIRLAFSQRRRNASFVLGEVLACPNCHSIELSETNDSINCRGCGDSYPVRNGIPIIYPHGREK